MNLVAYENIKIFLVKSWRHEIIDGGKKKMI